MSIYHEETKFFIEHLSRAPVSRNFTVESLRAICDNHVDSSNTQFGGTKFELFIPASDGETISETIFIPVYIYRPSIYDKNLPVLIYFHGGGMIAGTRDMIDSCCKHLCDMGKCLIVSVEYRRIPDHPLLAPYDDGVNVARWVLLHKQLLGAGPDSVVGVGGDSAGGKIAASVAHDVPGLTFQILIYPHLCVGHDLPSYQEFANEPFDALPLILWLDEFNLHNENPRCASIQRTDFTKLPPVLFIVAEFDSLRDESYEYAKKLTKHNVYHELVLMKGVCHGFFNLPGLFKKNCEIAYSVVTEFINKFCSKKTSQQF